MLDFDWIVEGQLGTMAMPWPEEIADLRALGVRGVLSLTSRVPEGLPAADMKHMHIPIADFRAPSLEQLEQGVEFIATTLMVGGAVAVHCAAGRGRSGTFAAAFLVSEGADPYDAIQVVRRRRPGSIETTGQERSIVQFAEYVRGEMDG